LLKDWDLSRIEEDNTDIYFDNENPKKKIPNKIVDYILGKKKLLGEKLKVKN
jgi:hypothetical protein